MVGNQVAGQTQLGQRGEDEPAPPVGLLGGTHFRGGRAERLFRVADRVLNIKPANVCPPNPVQVRGGVRGSGPPQPQGLGLAVAAAGQPGDPQADEGALHDGDGPVRVAVRALEGMQPVPCVYLDVAVLLVFTGVCRIRRWPGARLVAAEPGAVAAGTPALPWLVWRRWAEELPVVADTHHDLGISIAQPDGELDRVEAGVEGEQWG